MSLLTKDAAPDNQRVKTSVVKGLCVSSKATDVFHMISPVGLLPTSPTGMLSVSRKVCILRQSLPTASLIAMSSIFSQLSMPTIKLSMSLEPFADTRIPSFARDFPRAMNKLTTEPISKTASTALLAFPSNTPGARDALDWLTVNRPRLSADQRALLLGYEPRCLLQYEHDTVPPLLVISVDGATAAMVAARDVTRMSIMDQNRKRDKLKGVMVADIKEGLFNDIEASMLETAALLLSQFKIDHKQAPPFGSYRDRECSLACYRGAIEALGATSGRSQ